MVLYQKKIIFLFFFQNDSKKESIEIYNDHFESLFLNCFNIGLASAKYISFNWNFEIENIIRRINSLSKNKIKIILDQKQKAILFDSKVKGLPKTEHYNLSNQLIKKYNCFLPINIKKEPYSIKIPHIYYYLYSILLSLELQNNGLKIIKYPNLYLTIKYHTLTNEILKKKYLIKLKIIRLAKNNNLSEICSGQFSVKEILN